MKRIRNSWLVSGVAGLGVLVAACSSKSTDEGAGGSGNATSSSGGINSGGGNGSTTTGGKTAASTTGGRTATGGSTGFDSNTYCNGLFKGQSCSQTQVQADVREVNMLIVLDESGSMNDSPASGAASKWQIMKTALNTALTKVDNDINFGLLLFPYAPGGIPSGSSDPTETCAVPDDVSVAVNVPIGGPGTGPSTLTDVLNTIAGQSPAGGTPTARALQQAYAYFTTGDGRNLSGTKWVLLATDGGPNCNSGLTCDAAQCTQNLDGKCAPNVNCCVDSNGASIGYVCLDDVRTTSQIQLLAAVGIDTFVIGIPGTEAYATSLNDFATAGKVPNTNGTGGELYYAISAASAQQDLIDAFGDITTKLIHSCDIALASNPPDPTKVNVAIDCVPQPVVPTGSPADAGANGYYIDYTKNPAHLILVGAPCNNLVTTGAHNVDVIAGCPVIN